MESRDILAELASGEISSAEAEAMCDRIIESEHAGDVKRLLMLSDQEWTAFGQGAPFTTLAEWRLRGWPTRCVMCGKPISVKEYGWLVRERTGAFVLEHVQCPP